MSNTKKEVEKLLDKYTQLRIDQKKQDEDNKKSEL